VPLGFRKANVREARRQVVQHYKAGGPGWQTRIDLDLLGKIGARNKGPVATASAPRRRMKAKAA